MTFIEMLKKYWFVLVIAIILIAVFFPKYAGYSYGGLVRMNMTLYREEQNCLGFKYSTHGDEFGLTQCVDCGKTFYCAGIPLQKTCYEWSTNNADTSSEKQVECR